MELNREISKHYEDLRLKNEDLHRNRLEEIYRKIPEVKEIDEIIYSLGIKSSKEQILHPNADALLEASSEIENLKKEKKKLLTKNGYSENYLEPIYYCNDCKDTGYIEDKKCHCLNYLITDKLYKMSNLSYTLEKENFNTFNINIFSTIVDEKEEMSPRENISEILNAAKYFINNFDEKNDHNLLFYGPTGQGKTFMLNSIAKELMDMNKSVIYQTAYEMVDLLEKKRFQKDEISNKKYQLLFEVDLLVVDDLGIEVANSFTNSEIFNIINTRLLRGKKTIISTNLSPKELSNTYTDRVFSRVFQKFDPYKFFGEDLRWQKEEIWKSQKEWKK